MKRGFLVLLLAGFLVPMQAAALTGFTIKSFDSRIEVQKNTKLRVTETIEVYFNEPRHGIYRVVPANDLRVIEVSDNYSVSRSGGKTTIKIGDADRTITGGKLYRIVYEVGDEVRRFSDHDEVYWNVTGSDWEGPIEKATAEVISPWAEINRTECYEGVSGSRNRCRISGSNFESVGPVGQGAEMTIVVGLDKENQLVWPARWPKYLLALAPGLMMGIWWYLKGRDLRYKSDNIYVPDQAAGQEMVPVGVREHLPLVYAPVAGLTPAEAGTIIDQKVDINDIVAEITEFARLGYIEIKKVDKDYLFLDKKKEPSGLRDYQKKLLESVIIGAQLSKMKGHFSRQIEEFKNELYDYLDKQKIFVGRPDNIRGIVMIIGIGVLWFFVAVIGEWMVDSGATGVVFAAACLAAAFFGYHLSRRSAWGHSLYRQLVGLKYFVGKGKWRYDIAEKNLFLEEILPLAISLGVVGKLAADMKELGLTPPAYTGQVSVAGFNSWSNSLSGSLAYRASGGSGFGGGGGSGGGGGGGGGGSW